LIPASIDDALGLVKANLALSNVTADTHLSSASLEDVFVAVTMKPQQRAA
jgi:hypothetical protein